MVGAHYLSDDYTIDYVVHGQVLLACAKSHLSTLDNEPKDFITDESGTVIGVVSTYWDFVLSGIVGKSPGIKIQDNYWYICKDTRVPEEQQVWENTGVKAKMELSDLTPEEIEILQRPGKEVVTEFINNTITQETGQDSEKIMSQKAVTTELDKKATKSELSAAVENEVLRANGAYQPKGDYSTNQKVDNLQEEFNDFKKDTDDNFELVGSTLETLQDNIDVVADNIPTKVSELENDSNYQTRSNVDTLLQPIKDVIPLTATAKQVSRLSADVSELGQEVSQLGREVSELNGAVFDQHQAETISPTRNGSAGNPGNVNAVVWLNIPCAGSGYIHFRINKPFAAAGNIYVFAYTLPNGSYRDNVNDDIAKGFYQDAINDELILSVKGLNSFTIQCYETSLPFNYPSSCTPLRVTNFADGEGLEYYFTKDNTIDSLDKDVSQLSNEVNHISDFTIINDNYFMLPNFDESSQMLDFGADPVFYCRGKCYVAIQIWASDKSKYRAIPWPSPGDVIPGGDVGPALILVFNTNDCTFVFRRYTDKLGKDECIVGGLRTSRTSKHVIPHMPFQFTINKANKSTDALQGRRCTLIATDPSHIVLPDFNTETKTLTFSGDCDLFIGSNKFNITNKTATLQPADVTAYKLWFNTDTVSFNFTGHGVQYSTDNMVLVGGMRRAGNGDIYADFPFEITFNGEQAGRLYRVRRPYLGEKIVVNDNAFFRQSAINYGAFGTISYSGAQGMTIYDNRYLFRAYASNGGSLVVMDLRNKAILGAFGLASATSGHHVNCINLGEKYDSSDKYPLLYISEAYNAKRCFVERVANDASGSTLVQTITFVGTMPERNDGNSFAVDTFGGRLFMVVHTASHDVDVYVFALPSISVTNVNLTDSDIISRFSVLGINNIMQGVVYNNGKLLMPFGYGNSTYPGQLLAIDVDTKKIVSKVDLSFIAGEPEDTAIADNCVVVAMASNNIYYLKFD